MKGLGALLRDQPAMVGTVVSAVVTVGVVLGLDAKLAAAVGGLVSVLAGLWIRAQVYVASTVVKMTTDAAVQAVTCVSGSSAGGIGTLTETGAATATQAAKNVLDAVAGPADSEDVAEAVAG